MAALTFETPPGAYRLPPPSRAERQRVLDRLRALAGRVRLRDLARQLYMPTHDIERIVSALRSFDQVSVETIPPRVGRPSRWLTAL